MRKKDDNKFEPFIEVCSILLALGIIAVLASIFYISSRNCGEVKPLLESKDCRRGFR